MNRIGVIFFLIAIALILFILCLSAWDTKEGELFAGILLLYTGVIILFRGIRKKTSPWYGIWLRGIMVGIMCVVTGLVIIITYFI